MAIRIVCPSCRTLYGLADHLAGKTVRCKKCNETFVLPNADTREKRESIQTRPKAPQRALARDEDEEEAPRLRRRARDEDDELVRPIRSSNQGLLIGLIACGAGLMLLLAGAIVLIVFVTADRTGNSAGNLLSGGDDSWPTIKGMPNAPANGVMLHIEGVVDANTQEAIADKLQGLAAEGGNFSLNSMRQGNRMTVVIRPVHDVQAFAQKVDFGTVDKVDGRIITITARKVAGPPANADAVTKALNDLKSTNANRRREAVRKLKDTLPDERRAEVVKALEPLVNDSDHFTRRWAIEALGIWGTKDAVPILLKAMRDKDTRREAMKALGRLKDERAVEPIAERLEAFFDRHDAEEALKAMGPIAEKAVLARLNHQDWMVRVAVCHVLAVIGTKESIPPLEKVLAAGQGLFAGENIHVAPEAERAIKAIKARQ